MGFGLFAFLGCGPAPTPGVPVILGVNHDVIDIAGGGHRFVVHVNSSVDCTGITIGGVACTSFAIDDPTHVSGVPGAHAAGVVDVIVTNGIGSSTTGTELVEYWSPAQLATGTKDYFLDANKGITLVSGKVYLWASQGTTSRTFTQGTAASQPVPTTNAFGTLNGITFDGTDDFMSCTDPGAYAGASIFAVAKWTSTDTTTTQSSWNVPLTIVGGSGGWDGFGASGGQIAWKKPSTAVILRGSGLNDGNPRSIGLTSTPSTPTVNIYLGDTQQGATETPGGSASVYADSVGRGYATDYFAGHLGALLVVEGVISGANITRWCKWATQRFAVTTASVPAITSLSYSQLATDGTGAPVTITGANLAGATKVTISGVDITPTSSTSTTVTFMAPARTAASGLSLTVTTPGGTTGSLSCSYWGPEATSVPLISRWKAGHATTESGGYVTQVGDLVGPITQAQNASRKGSLIAIDSAFGGHPTIGVGSGQASFDFVQSGSWSPAPSAISILQVSSQGINSTSYWAVSASDPYQMLWAALDASNRIEFFRNGTNKTRTPSSPVASLGPAITLFTDSGTADADALRIYQSDLTNPMVASVTRWNSATSIGVGRGVAGITGIQGKWAETFAWSGVLSADDKAKLANWLMNARAYGITVTATVPSLAVSSVSPTSGTERGGVAVTITGTGFTGATAASIGGVELSSFTVVNSTTITGTTKMQTPGAKNVMVSNGTTASLTNGYTVNEVGLYTSGVKFRGINRAGPEYLVDWDGWTGQTYFEIPSGSPLTAEIAKYKQKGFNIVRLPFAWERMQHTLNGALATPYSTNYKNLVGALTGAGLRVIVECHNYGRYATGTHDGSGNQISGYDQHVLGDGTLTSAHLVDLWGKVATLFASNHYVYFGLMNEPHAPMTGMNSTSLFASFNAQIAAIRSAGAKQLVLVSNTEGSEVTHWDVWSPIGGPLDSVAALDVVDSENNFAFEHHVYIADPTSTSFSEALETITNWSRTNGRKAIITEGLMHNTAANGSAAWSDLMTYLNANNDVWLGVLPWNLSPQSYLDEDEDGSHVNDTAAMAWYAPFLTTNIVT